jgi:hypothetical protein
MTKLKVSTTEAEKMTYRTCKFTEWLREIYAGLGYFPGKLPTGWGNFKQIYGEPTVNLPKIVKIYGMATGNLCRTGILPGKITDRMGKF